MSSNSLTPKACSSARLTRACLFQESCFQEAWGVPAKVTAFRKTVKRKHWVLRPGTDAAGLRKIPGRTDRRRKLLVSPDLFYRRIQEFSRNDRHNRVRGDIPK